MKPSAHAALVTDRAILAIVLLPIYWMVSTSLKSNKEITQDPTLYPHAPVLRQLPAPVLRKAVRRLSHQFASAVTASRCCVSLWSFGSLGAYAIARFRLPFGLERKVGLALLTLRIVPPVVILIPVYLLMLQLSCSTRGSA